MENDNLNPTDVVEVQEPESMSISDRMLGIFMEPKRVFENFRDFGVKTSDWLLPTVVAIVVGIVLQIVLMNNPSIKADMREKQIQAMQKMVEKGQMTQEIADAQVDNLEKMQTFQYIGIVVGIPIVSFIILVLVALVYWLLAKFGLRGDIGYVAAMGIVGITNLISLVEGLTTSIIALLTGKVGSTPSIALLFQNMSQGPLLSILNKINPFTFWSLIIIGMGLAIVSKKEIMQGIIWVFGLWIVYVLLVVFAVSKIPFLSGFSG